MILIDDLKYKSQCFYQNEDGKSILRVLFTDGTSAMIFYRLMQFFRRMHLSIIGWIFQCLNKWINGCVIGLQVDFGKGFVIMHPVGVVINGAVKGGENIVIESGVVIGAAHHGLPVQVPRLKSHIKIGSGAKLLGSIVIGSHVKIGANAVVLHDIPDGATAVGVPARVIKTNDKTEK